MIYLLTNDVGYYCTQTATTSVGDGNYLDIISGPRDRWHMNDSMSAVQYYTLSKAGAAYVPGVGYAVIARADWALTLAGTTLTMGYNDSGGTPHTLVTKNPLVAADLVGPTGQDFVASFTPVDMYRAWAQGVDAGLNDRFKLSKLYFSPGFTFGNIAPALNPPPVWQRLPEGENLAKPPRATAPLAVEARLSLTWHDVALADAVSFYALPNLLSWPLFLYDPDCTIWDWKLEHVIIESVQDTLTSPETRDITVTFLRLKHYP